MTSSVVHDAEFYYDEAVLFRLLPESAQQVLADRLMPDDAWKMVADRLGFSAADIETLATRSCPAYQMLREWGRREGSTRLVLRQTLDHIGRRDVVALVDNARKRESSLSASLID